MIQGLEAVDGVHGVLRLGPQHGGGQGDLLPDTQRCQPLPQPVLFPFLCGDLEQAVKFIPLLLYPICWCLQEATKAGIFRYRPL